jgi:hypothetical protein
MSALGEKRTLKLVGLMSALPPKADIAGRQLNVRFVPKADSCTAAILSFFDLLGRADYIRRAPHRCGAPHSRAHQWVGNSATGKSAAERRGCSRGW